MMYPTNEMAPPSMIHPENRMAPPSMTVCTQAQLFLRRSRTSSLDSEHIEWPF